MSELFNGIETTEDEYKYIKLENSAFVISYDDWNNKPPISVVVFDEYVYFDYEGKPISNLNLPIDFFSSFLGWM